MVNPLKKLIKKTITTAWDESLKFQIFENYSRL